MGPSTLPRSQPIELHRAGLPIGFVHPTRCEEERGVLGRQQHPGRLPRPIGQGKVSILRTTR